LVFRDYRNPLEFTSILADEFDIDLFELTTDHRQLTTTCDILVNATPVGMRGPNETLTPVTADQFRGVKFIYDLVTRPDETPLLGEAKRAGIPAIGGVEMLIAQGMRQFEIWTGFQAPAKVMGDAILRHLKRGR